MRVDYISKCKGEEKPQILVGDKTVSEQIEKIREKLLNGIFPMDLSLQERELWSKYKESILVNQPEIELTEQQEKELWEWLNNVTDEDIEDEV